MLDLGLIKPAANGTFHILPILQRSLERTVALIDRQMLAVGAQKLTMPTLTPVEHWKKSGRFETAATELLTTKDRHDKLHILSPVGECTKETMSWDSPFFRFQTHEEAITAMIASTSPLSYRQLPLRLYQITQKFRDEMKPRFGLMRTKEFLMKDLYTFDTNLEAARHTYDEVNRAYQHLLTDIGVPFVKVAGDTGIIGGSQSHEYHYTSSIGEDQLITCSGCQYAANKELQTDGKCGNCGGEQLLQQPGIEVAHTFILEDKYSKILGATYLQANGKPTPLIMGCYGIGVTRLIAACVECLSTETEIRWPFVLAPFRVCILPPKVRIQAFWHENLTLILLSHVAEW
jgi:prolyl-tRNA synthetase